MKQQFIYAVVYDESYEPTTVYGIFKTEKAAQKAIDEELKANKSFRGWISKLPLNPPKLSMDYLYEEA